MSDQKTLLPTQLGFQRKSNDKTSVVVIGKGATSYLGLGPDLSPDDLETLEINISQKEDGGTYTLISTISINFSDLKAIIEGNNALTEAKKIDLKAIEVSICSVDEESGEATEKKMVVLGSEPYAANEDEAG